MADLGVWTIPGYVMHERLHAGLVTATYLASRSADGRPVLIEVISEEFNTPEVAQRFRTTLTHVSTLRHPVLPRVRETGEADGLLYVVTSAVRGRTLGDVTTPRNTLTVDDALAICTELADALDVLAAGGIAHGAISPSTVWITDRRRAPSGASVSLRGFGTTPLRASRLRTHPTAPPPAEVLYAAPEQLDGAPGERTDQYALACLTLHCLTGVPPFDAATTTELFDVQAAGVADRGFDGAAQLPPRVVAAIRRGMAIDPAERFDSATAFAAAIGGTSRRSWTWMLDNGQQPSGPAREIDVRDPDDGADGLAGRAADDAPMYGGRGQTSRSLAEVDWLPGSASRSGPRRRASSASPPPGVPAPSTSDRSTTSRSTAAPTTTTSTASRRRRRERSRRAWQVALLLAGLLLLIPLALFARSALFPSAEDDGAEQQQAQTGEVTLGQGGQGATQGITATWRVPVDGEMITTLAPADTGVVGVAGDQLMMLDQATGNAIWQTPIGDAIQELSLLGPTAIVRTSSEFAGISVSDGSISWRAPQTDLPNIETFITARGRMFAAGRSDDGNLVVHAIDPIDGTLGWSINSESPPSDASGPPLVSFDGSEEGGRTLYAADGATLHAFDVTTRQERWQIDVEGGPVVSLTTVGGAVLTVSDDGRVCRFHADDGTPAWTECATVDQERGSARIAQIRDSRVILTSPYEVVAIDYTSGQPQWRIASEDPLQPVIAANRAATYIAAPDGTIEAIAHTNGRSLWESAPFGTIDALAASDDAVFLTSSDGQLTRLEAPDPAAASGG